MNQTKYGPKVSRVCRQLGSQIKRSRLARKTPQELIAGRANISISTMKRIEQGDPSVAMSSFLMALHALGILPEVLNIEDELGEELLEMDMRKRAPRVAR